MNGPGTTDKAMELWKGGLDTAQIASAMNRHESFVYNALAMRRGKTEPYRHPREESQDRFYAKGGWL